MTAYAAGMAGSSLAISQKPRFTFNRVRNPKTFHGILRLKQVPIKPLNNIVPRLIKGTVILMFVKFNHNAVKTTKVFATFR
jgi:hypothetical protein